MNRTDGKPRARMGSVKEWLVNLPTGRWVLAERTTKGTIRSLVYRYAVKKSVITRAGSRGVWLYCLPPLPE